MSSGGGKVCPERTHPDLWEAMKALPARQYQAITLVYWGGKTLAEIGVEMGMSLQRVGQIIQEAKKNIHSALENRIPHTLTHVRGKEFFFIPAIFSKKMSGFYPHKTVVQVREENGAVSPESATKRLKINLVPVVQNDPHKTLDLVREER